MKRFYSLLILLFGVLCTLMAHDVVVNGIYYNLDNTNKTAKVTYKGISGGSEKEYSGSVIIPSSITYNSEIYSVTSIGADAFYECSSLTSITIPNSITSIGVGAFTFCSGLTSITIPNSVTLISREAFKHCTRLTSVTIPSSVTEIGTDAFSSCSSLTSIVWNAKNCNVLVGSYRSDGAFYNVRSQITSFTFGNEVERIPSYLCYEMSNLKNITIPNSVTSIDPRAFSGCSGLTSISIPNSVTSIGTRAFSSCSGLTSITIPKSVTSIGEDAFIYCNSLTSIVWNAKNCADITSNTKVAFFEAISSQITSFTFGNEVERIPKYLCYGMSKLKNITIPNSVTSIGYKAFSGCSELISVSIGESVKEIGNYAFESCDKLGNIIAYPTTVPKVSGQSFSNYNANLYVPCASKADYKSDDIFGNFQYIECLAGEGGDENQGGDITLYYVNKTGWSAVNAYVWDDASGTPIVAWSGEPATKLDKTIDRYEVYSYTFDSSLADRIIFNNGNGGAGNQTDNLTFDASKPYFYDGVWYASLTFDTNGGGTVDPTPGPEPEVYAYNFFVAGNGGSDATGVWCNGIEWNSSAEVNRMKDPDKDGFYEITYTAVPAGTWSFKVVAHFDAQQWLGGDFLDTQNSSAGITVQNGGNIAFTLTKSANVTIKVDAANGKISLTTPSGSFGKVTIDYFTVANTDECLVENRFTAANNNTLKYTENIQILEGNDFGFVNYRILGNCNYALFEKHISTEVAEAGIYDITIVFNGDYENPDFTVTAVKQVETPDNPEPEPTPGGDITLYYVNKTGWFAVNAYVWDYTTDKPIDYWPGESATKLDKTVDRYEVYSYTFDSNLADRIIFNNGNNGAGNQTGNLTFEASKPYFYDGVWYASLTFDTNGGGTVEPNPDDDSNVSIDEVTAIMIYAKEHTIYCDEPFQVYTITGLEVTHLNGALEGVYILKTKSGNRLISVW